jgi:pimeloyl-ACP methyl ester carboxylesterase
MIARSGTGGSVHWLERGQGMPVVLLHGLGGDIGFWTAEIEALAEHVRVIAIDLRGSGQTPMSGPTTIEELADDVAAVLDAAGVSSCDVVGFSMGGLVAQAFALRWPTRLRRLVLASTFAVMNAQARRFLDAVLSVYEGGCTPTQMFDLIAPWLFSVRFVADPQNAPFFVYPENDPNEQPRPYWCWLYRAQQAFDATVALPRIVAPTLVLVGDEDRLVSTADARTLASLIPDARLEVIDRAGHLINVEQPDAFRGALVAFLRA